MILDDIFANRRKQVEMLKREKPFSELEKEAEAFAAGHKTRGFSAALKKNGLSVIAEVKKASPSKGIIKADFDPVKTAVEYEKGGADALSLLTEQTYFLGSAEYLERIRQKVELPILRKDFIFDPWQICQARLIGADAILLIAAMLDTKTLGRLISYAAGLGLEALVETHCKSEIESACEAGAKIFGINNRNLKDFSVDTDCAAALSGLLPPGSVFVAESGIKTRGDALKMRKAGADAVLIGEALMRAEDINSKLSEFSIK